MVKVVFRDSGGSELASIDVEPGSTLMAAAVQHRVAGIEAICGGSMVCGTCHVHVSSEWQGKLPDQSEAEAEMLEYSIHADPMSRLSCQITLTEELDGLEVTVPPSQG